MNKKIEFWAKTKEDGSPGISVFNHCLNVGSVAEAILKILPSSVVQKFPSGAVTLAALHDIGKITLGFQLKCPHWAIPPEVDSEMLARARYSPSDHALVSQYFLQQTLLHGKERDWGIPVGSHHGRPKGRQAKLGGPEALSEFSQQARLKVAEALSDVFGTLPQEGPPGSRTERDSILWLIAGWITVADWIGSNEDFFPQDVDYDPDQSRAFALNALCLIHWPGGRLKRMDFSDAFGFVSQNPVIPNSVQTAALTACRQGRFTIIEAPMGSGKTEAALYAALDAVCSNENQGIYFALPTQVTSNRIHLRIKRFLENTLENPAHLRLAHAGAWLESDFSLNLSPSYHADESSPKLAHEEESPNESIREARSWFSSSKRALIAPYGVGTVDQALLGVVAVKHFFVRRFALAGKVVILDEIHSYDIYTGALIGALIRELMMIGCKVIVLSATLTAARRQELLEAAGIESPESASNYPLITSANPGEIAVSQNPDWDEIKTILIRCEDISEEEAMDTLIRRSLTGEKTLWIRNTVNEAQQSYASLKSLVAEDAVELGLLHSRFAFQDRQVLENYWLTQLGKERPDDNRGVILVATQVVEQSVDIDLDFMISDLAPTDMMIQRMGRLWRHERYNRPCSSPEFWIRRPTIPEDATTDIIKKSFGKSALVYDPYVLVRTVEVFKNRKDLIIPTDIRECLESTYCEMESSPASWGELLNHLNHERDRLKRYAESAMRVLDRPLTTDQENQPLTRRKGAPTVSVILLRSMKRVENGCWRLTGLDGGTVKASEFQWEIHVARFIHRWLVKVPKNMAPLEAHVPSWMENYSMDASHCACVLDDGSVKFTTDSIGIFYSKERGLYRDISMASHNLLKTDHKVYQEMEDLDLYDDEFDY